METKQISSCLIRDRLPPLSSSYQWFVAQNLEAGYEIFYTIENPLAHYRSRIPELLGRRIRGSFHGWMILSSHPNIVMWSLWNPITSKLIRLPPFIHEHADSDECCLSSPPDDSNSIFFILSGEKPTIAFCRLDCKRKKLKWTQMSYARQLKSISGHEGRSLQSPTCCNGKVYAITLGHDYSFVLQLDIVVKDKEVVINLLQFVKLVFPPYNKCPSFTSCLRHYHFLKGSCAELFFIVVGSKDETMKTVNEVVLYKLDMNNMAWEEMEDLADGIFFIELASDYNVFHKHSIASELGGYVHILGEIGEVIYSYHVKDRTISISSMPNLLQENQVSAWAMLECRFEDDHESKQEDNDDQIVARLFKGDEIEFKGVTNESALLSIPFHILEMVLEFCVGVEYMNFRATCKRCYSATSSIKWSNPTTIKRLKMYSLDSLWLMVLDQNRGIITFIDPMCGDKYFINTPQELTGDYQICYSKYGWLLMHKVSGPLKFFNPFTNDIRKLPRVSYLQSFCFSAPPTSPDCMVVGFTQGYWNVCVHFVAREQSWLRIILEFEDLDPYSFLFSTFYGQEIYALADDGGIDVFKKIGYQDYCWDRVLSKSENRGCRSFLASCDQHILLVIVGEFGKSIDIFNLNDSEEWDKLDSLGKHMIFISDTTCLCVEAKSPEMENKIYFPRLLHQESGKIVFYSLDTCRCLQKRPLGMLPSNIVPNHKEQINSITTKSGFTLVGPYIPPYVLFLGKELPL
ncbi:PAZ domain-containing protein [Tanacetum coccineum]